ncbi:glycosyltransferase, partial [Salmonella enterica]|nr:glycosyltransferase [Salmonella enterica]
MNTSVITVTYNNAEGLNKTLESLCLLKVKPYEIIIIDANSIDNTKAIVKKY